MEERQRIPDIARVLTNEEELFARTLTLGLRYLEQVEPDERGMVSGAQLFKLHAEKGFPPDLAAEVLAERALSVDWFGYERAVEEHRQVSRASVETHFHTT